MTKKKTSKKPRNIFDEVPDLLDIWRRYLRRMPKAEQGYLIELFIAMRGQLEMPGNKALFAAMAQEIKRQHLRPLPEWFHMTVVPDDEADEPEEENT